MGNMLGYFGTVLKHHIRNFPLLYRPNQRFLSPVRCTFLVHPRMDSLCVAQLSLNFPHVLVVWFWKNGDPCVILSLLIQTPMSYLFRR